MSWEFDQAEQPENTRDRTKLVWGVILVSLVLMAALLAITSREPRVTQSRAYVKHIYIPFERETPGDRDRALALVSDVRNRIIAGELTFEDAARRYSSERGFAEKGGHLGWTTRDDMADGAAKDFIWNGPLNELSNILESGTAFHLIFVENREFSRSEEYERELKERVTSGAKPTTEPQQ